MMKKGLVHIYTGNGKGKTSAALGLGLRAFGQGLKVCIFQFLKKGRIESGELKAAGKLGRNFKVVRFDEPWPLLKGTVPGGAWGGKKLKPGTREILERKLAEDLECARRIMRRGNLDVIVLDEIITAMGAGLVDSKPVLDFIRNKSAGVELILTGRGRITKELKGCADYVSRMQELKHPFRRGVGARKGIEY